MTGSSAASWSPSSTVARNALGSPIAWSAGRTRRTESGSRAARRPAARPMAAAVFFGSGSPISCSRGNSGSSAAIRSAIAAPVRTSQRSGGMRPSSRSAVSRTIVRSEMRGNSCLGLSGVEAGQNRSPTPPARMTAWFTRANVARARRAGQAMSGLALSREVRVLGGQPLEPAADRRVPGPREGRVGVDEIEGGVAGRGEKVDVALDIGDPEIGRAVLAGAEHVPLAAEPEVLLGDHEPVVRRGEDPRPLAGMGAGAVGDDQEAVRRLLPPSY